MPLNRLVQATLRLASDLDCVRLFAILGNEREIAIFKQNFTASAKALTIFSLDELLRRRGNTTEDAFGKRMHARVRSGAYCITPLHMQLRRSTGGLKKIFGLLEMHSLGLTHAWVLDAESLPLRPFSFCQIFRDATSRGRLVVFNASSPSMALKADPLHNVDRRCAHRGLGIPREWTESSSKLTYRGTDYWFYNTADVAAMVHHIEASNKCAGPCFTHIYATYPANEYSYYLAYMLNVAPEQRRPKPLVLPEAVEGALRQLNPEAPSLNVNLHMGLDLSLVLFSGCLNSSKTSRLAHEQRARLLTSPLFSWIHGWRFDYVFARCRRDAEALLQHASHITWATSNYWWQVNVSHKAREAALEGETTGGGGTAMAALVGHRRLSTEEASQPPSLYEHTQYHGVNSSAVANAQCSPVKLPLQHVSAGEMFTQHSFCHGVVVTWETGLWLGGWHEPQVVYSILNPMRASGTFIDVGANAGLFSIVALSGRYRQVLSFEPQPACADEMLFTRMHNGAPAHWRVYNAAVAKTPQTFHVPATGCGMNWQTGSGRSRQFKAHSVPLSSVVSTMDQTGPAFIKIDCDGSEVSVVEAILDLLPGGGPMLTGGLDHLPEIYVEVDPIDWRHFGVKKERGHDALRSLGSRYEQIYFFSAMTTSCEGIGLVDDSGRNLTEPYLFVSDNHPPPGMVRWVGRQSRPQWILRVLDYAGLLDRCLSQTKQLNLWFAR